MTDQPIGVAVIGAGNWGKNLVRHFAALPGVRLEYVCDLDAAVRQTVTSLYPDTAVTAELNDPLSDPAVDAVVVAVDAPLHHKIGKAALEAGKHTYIEKPLTLSSADAIELTLLAQAKRLKLMVGHLLEYHPAVTYMKKMIDEQQIGQPHYLYCQRLNLGIVRREENAWWSLAPHDISVAGYLFDAEPISISVSGQAYLQPGIEDVVFASLKYADGRMAHIHVSWLDPHKARKMTLVGSQKMVVFDDMAAAEQVRIYDKGADVTSSVESYAEAITLRTGDILIPKIPAEEPLRMECRHFIDAIRHDTEPRSNGADGVRVVKILEAGSASLAQDGAPIAIGAEPVALGGTAAYVEPSLLRS